MGSTVLLDMICDRFPARSIALWAEDGTGPKMYAITLDPQDGLAPEQGMQVIVDVMDFMALHGYETGSVSVPSGPVFYTERDNDQS